MKKLKVYLFMLLFLVLILNSQTVVDAADFSSTNNGTYSVNATLSCYVNAMGGVEFGGSLLKSAEVTVTSGKAVMKLTFGKSAVTIYGITCDTFVDASPSGSANGQEVQAGTIGYYDKNGNLNTSNVTTTLSTDTALNPANEAVLYVVTMSFPLEQISSTYQLTLYVNSNVMGSQFGAGGSPAALTVDWSNVPGVDAENTSSDDNQNASGNTDAVGSANAGENVDSSGSENTSENNAGAAAAIGDAASVQDAETSETDEGKSAVAVEKDGLNVYYANSENDTKAETDAEEISDAIADKVVLGVVIVCGAAALGAGSVVLKKKLKRKNKV